MWPAPLSPPVTLTFSPLASLLLVLLCTSVTLQCWELQLAYVTATSLYHYSCSHQPLPCNSDSLSDCRCIQSHSNLNAKCLTVWFTSPSNTTQLLNNLEVNHLTLIYCGPGGARGKQPPTPEGHFAVHHLERLTVINLPHRLHHPWPNANKATNTDSNVDPERVNDVYFDTNRLNRDINLDCIKDPRKDALNLSPSQIQDIFLGRELGAAYHEQARLGIIRRSVLEWGAEVKAYTVQTHIDSDGILPFPELHLPKLQKTPVIYVSFVY